MRVSDISCHNQWCRYCSSQDLCDDGNCEYCFQVSFASSPMVKFWSILNEKEPRMVTRGSAQKYWFDCSKCKHSFQISLNAITRGNWCSYCANQKLCDNEHCNVCLKKSFASHHRSKYWSSKNTKTPRETAISSNMKYWFDCEDCGNDFYTTVDRVSLGGTWCPICKNKTEKQLYQWLTQTYPQYTISTPGNQKFQWCINPSTGKHLPFDFYIKELELIIELDGPQHFRQIGKWETPEKIQARDRIKEFLALKNGLSVARILQDDVIKNKNNWKEKIDAVLKIYEQPKLLYLYNSNIEDITYVCELVYH